MPRSEARAKGDYVAWDSRNSAGLFIEGDIAIGQRCAAYLQIGKVEKLRVEKVGRNDRCERSKNIIGATRRFFIPFAQHMFDLLALQIFLTAA